MRHRRIVYSALSTALFLGTALFGAYGESEAPSLAPSASCSLSQSELADQKPHPDEAAARIKACTLDLSTQDNPEQRSATLMSRSEAYYETKASVRALADLEAAAKLVPQTGEMSAWRGVLYEALSLNSLSEREANHAIEQQFTASDVYALRGADEAFDGDFDSAIGDLNFALSQSPDESIALIARGYAEAETGDLDQAVRDYDHAEASSKRQGNTGNLSGTFYLLRGRAYFALDQYEAALTDFQRAEAINPDIGIEDTVKDVMAAMSAPAVMPPAKSQNAPSQPIGDTHTCAAYYPYLSTLLREPGDVLIHYDVSASGAISSVGIDKTSGIARLDQAAAICVTHHWRNTPAMQNGVAMASPGHRALIHFVAPPMPPGSDTRARTLASIGQYDEAIAEYDRVLGSNPEDVKVLFRRGLTYYAMKNYPAAIKDFDQAVRASPDMEDAIAGRELVRIATTVAKP